LLTIKAKRQIDYFVMVLLLFASSGANIVTLGRFNIAYIAVGCFIYLKLLGQKISINFIKILFFWLFYNFLYLIQFQDIAYYFILRISSSILLALLTLSILKENFIIIYEKVVYYFSIISLFFFSLQVLSFNTVYRSLKAIQGFLNLYNPIYDGEYFVNIFIYTINSDIGNYRNCGFMWEPGPFSVILGLALAFRLSRNSFQIDKVVVVLFIATLTTFSTTGYLILIVILIMYYRNKKAHKRIYLFPILIIFLFSIYQVSFVSKKINNQLKFSDATYENAISAYKWSKKTQSLGRFAGLILNLRDFSHFPIIGIGGFQENMETVQYGYKIRSVNGLGLYLVTFGGLGFLILLRNFYASSSRMIIASKKNINLGKYLFVIFLISAFSFPMLTYPLFFAFQFYCFLRNYQ